MVGMVAELGLDKEFILAVFMFHKTALGQTNFANNIVIPTGPAMMFVPEAAVVTTIKFAKTTPDVRADVPFGATESRLTDNVIDGSITLKLSVAAGRGPKYFRYGIDRFACS